jgi:hypothetical protein
VNIRPSELRDDARDSRDLQADQVRRISEAMHHGRVSAQDGLRLLREQRRISAVRQALDTLQALVSGDDTGEVARAWRNKRQVLRELQEWSERTLAQALDAFRRPRDPDSAGR